MEIYIIWVVSSIASWFILCSGWRREFDVEVSDAIFFTFMSLFGPLSLVVSCVIWLAGCGKGKVIWSKI